MYYINKTTINIKIPIITNEYLRDFIFKNINMRRRIWNDFVEEANKYKDEFNNYNFKPLQYKTEYFKHEEEIHRYSEYCVGLSEQVAKDMKSSLKGIKTHNNKVFKKEINAELGKLNFHKRDNYYGSFKVGCKPYISSKDNLSSRVKIKSKNKLNFRVRGNYYGRQEERITLNLLENLYDEYDSNTNQYIRYYKESGITYECRFDGLDIKEISFIHQLGKFYIQLSVNVTYYINEDNVKSRIYDKAGIDTGIHHPFDIYDGNNHYTLQMSDKTSNKIHYLERRIKRLQNIMDKKIYGSNNYEKIRKKIRKLFYKISCIKRNWSYNICKFIVTRYTKICIDTFEQPDRNDHEDLPNKIIRKINYTNRFHCMYNTNEILKHMATKYHCEYYEAPENTTRTCCNCSHKNPHLPLSQRIFTCEKCGYTIDRDFNASQNCYNYL